MKLRLIVGLFLLFDVLSTQGQQINANEIEQAVKNPESKFFYPALLKRFNSLDTTLKKEDIIRT